MDHGFGALKWRHVALLFLAFIITPLAHGFFLAFFPELTLGLDWDVLLYIVIELVLAVLLMRHCGISLRRLIGKIPASVGWLRVAGIVACAAIFSLGLFTVLAYLFPDAIAALARLDPLSMATDPLATFLLIVVAAPVSEEILFRGLLLNKLSRKMRAGTAIIVSSLIFGLLHIDIIGAVVAGIILSLFYLRTKTLLVPMIAHAFNNFIAFVMIALLTGFRPGAYAELALIAPTATEAAIAAAAGTAAIVILLIYMRRNWPGKKTKLPY